MSRTPIGIRVAAALGVAFCVVAFGRGYTTVFPVHAASIGADLSRAQPPLPSEAIVADTRTGPHRFVVEVARTPGQQEIGLMHRIEVPHDGGMLFPYAEPARRVFWMKNTDVPLDIVFIGGDGKVTGVAPDATPLSEAPIASPGPATAVLELRAGTARAIDLEPGDAVSKENAEVSAPRG